MRNPEVLPGGPRRRDAVGFLSTKGGSRNRAAYGLRPCWDESIAQSASMLVQQLNFVHAVEHPPSRDPTGQSPRQSPWPAHKVTIPNAYPRGSKCALSFDWSLWLVDAPSTISPRPQPLRLVLCILLNPRPYDLFPALLTASFGPPDMYIKTPPPVSTAAAVIVAYLLQNTCRQPMQASQLVK